MSNQLEQYAELLRIRQAGGLRNTRITGGIFLVSMLGFVAYGLIAEPIGRSVYLSAAIIATLGLGYITTWVRLEITKNTLELVERIHRAVSENL